MQWHSSNSEKFTCLIRNIKTIATTEKIGLIVNEVKTKYLKMEVNFSENIIQKIKIESMFLIMLQSLHT